MRICRDLSRLDLGMVSGQISRVSPLLSSLQPSVVQPPGQVRPRDTALAHTAQGEGGVLHHLQPPGVRQHLLRPHEDPRLPRQHHHLQVVGVEGGLTVEVVNSTSGERVVSVSVKLFG